MYDKLRLLRARDASQISPQELNHDARALAIYKAVTEREDVRAAYRATEQKHQLARLRKTVFPNRTLTVLFEEITAYANAGATEPELRLFEAAISEYIGDHFVGVNSTPLPDLDMAECDAENEENRLAMLRLTQPDAVGDAEDEREAMANLREAAISITKARALRRRPRDRAARRDGAIRQLTYDGPRAA